MIRKTYVDYIKAIGIIFVVLGHINFANVIIKSWIYSFHMPLFFFATGLVMKPKKTYAEFMEKKFMALIIPYFVWALIYSDFTFRNILKIMYGSYSMIVAAGSLTSLWFLPAMFIAILIANTILCFVKNRRNIIIVSAVLMLCATILPKVERGYPWCVDVAVMGAGFVLLGNFVEDRVRRTQILKSKMISVTVLGFLLTLLSCFNKNRSMDYVLMANANYGNIFLFLSSAIGGCLFVYGIAKLLEGDKKKNQILDFLGKNTLIILVIHKPFIVFCKYLFEIIDLYWVFELVLTAIITLVLCSIGCVFVNKFAMSLAGKCLYNCNE